MRPDARDGQGRRWATRHRRRSDHDSIYVANTGPEGGAVSALGHTVSLIDGATCDGTDQAGCGGAAATVTVGVAPFGIAVDQSTNEIYVANNNGGDILSQPLGDQWRLLRCRRDVGLCRTAAGTTVLRLRAARHCARSDEPRPLYGELLWGQRVGNQCLVSQRFRGALHSLPWAAPRRTLRSTPRTTPSTSRVVSMGPSRWWLRSRVQLHGAVARRARCSVDSHQWRIPFDLLRGYARQDSVRFVRGWVLSVSR